MTTIAPDVLEYRKDLFISKLADWQETIDPCANGHVEHGPGAHLGRRIVHSVSRSGFGADWDYEDVVAFVRSAKDIGAAIEGERRRNGHVGVLGADGSVMSFEVRP